MPVLAKRARLERNKTRIALNLVAAGRVAIRCTVNFNKLDLVTVRGLVLVNYLVPIGQELDAVDALGHEEVNNDKCVIAEVLHGLLEEGRVVDMRTFRLFPPVAVHHFQIAILILRSQSGYELLKAAAVKL